MNQSRDRSQQMSGVAQLERETAPAALKSVPFPHPDHSNALEAGFHHGGAEGGLTLTLPDSEAVG